MFLILFEKAILSNIYQIGIILPMLLLGIETQIRTWSQLHVTAPGLNLGQSNRKALAFFIMASSFCHYDNWGLV